MIILFSVELKFRRFCVACVCEKRQVETDRERTKKRKKVKDEKKKQNKKERLRKKIGTLSAPPAAGHSFQRKRSQLVY